MIRKLSRGLALAVLVGSTTVNAALIPFAVNLTGAQEAPGPGDPDGTGTALLIFDSASNRLDWRITAKNIDPVVAAHIHSAPAGVAGPVVIDFSGALTGTVIDPDVASVLANPAGFYVNVHTPVFPAGAIRGQLTNVAPNAFAINLTGAQEAPGPGDPDGTGAAALSFDSASNSVDWLIAVANIDPVVAAHIHSAPAGVAGPVVIDFSGALTGTVIDSDVASVLANPAGFYVNVHTPVFPAGAVRGQLTARSSVVPEPASLALLAVVLAALAVARRRTQQLAR